MPCAVREAAADDRPSRRSRGRRRARARGGTSRSRAGRGPCRADRRAPMPLARTRARARRAPRRRPTNGVVAGRTSASSSGPSSRSRQARTGAVRPFTVSGPSSSARTAVATRRYVCSPSRISPPSARASSRAATLIASPLAKASRPWPGPTNTSPELTASVTASQGSEPCASSSASSATACRTSTAARTARRASSSCRLGKPKTADDRVADVLLDDASVALDRRGGGLGVARQDPMHRLGVESLRQASRVDEIREQEAHRPADAVGRPAAARLGCGVRPAPRPAPRAAGGRARGRA